MVIGFDIDNTIINSKAARNYYYETYAKENNLGSFDNISENNRKLFFEKHLFDILLNAKPFDGVYKVIDYLKKNNHKIILITRRGFNEDKKIIDITYELLKNNNIYYDEIYFKVAEKGKVAKENNIKLFVDDHNFNLESLEKYGVKALKYEDRENNGKYDIVYNWSELLDYIKKEGF